MRIILSTKAEICRTGGTDGGREREEGGVLKKWEKIIYNGESGSLKVEEKEGRGK